MRKLLSVLLIAMLGLSMFTACNPESSKSEDLVSVKLVEGQCRALTATLDFDLDDVKRWEYSAIKADKGLTTGQTGTSENKTTEDLGTNNETKLLSQGYWNFDLHGYDAKTDGNVICTGSVENVLVTLENNSVTILVAPKQKSKGTIVIKSNISILFDDGTTFKDTSNVYTKVVEVSNATTGAIIKSETKLDSDVKIESADSKITYKVVVSFIGDYGKSTRYTAAKATKYINVYDNLTTTVDGSITESGTVTIINAVAGSDNSSAEATIASDLFADDETDNQKKTNRDPITVVAASGLSTSSENTTVSVTESVITLPAGAVVKDSEAATSEGATLTMKSENLLSQASGSDTTTASEEKLAEYTITGQNGAPIATLEFGLTGASLDESLSKTNSDKAPTGYIYIATNQGDSFDVVNGNDKKDSTVKKTPTLNIGYLDGSGSVKNETDSQKPELLKYDKKTGYLEYRVYHFSTYVIFSDKYVASDSNGNLYETLDEAAEKVAEGATITLWKDIENSGKETEVKFVNNGATLNLNEKTVKRSLELGSIGCGDNKVMITIKDGTVDSSIIEHEDGGFNNGFAVGVWKPFTTIESGTYKSDNVVLNVQCQGIYDTNGNLVDEIVADCMTNLTIKSGTFETKKQSNVCVNQVIGKTIIDGGTFKAENGSIFKLEKGSSNQPSKVVINDGNFNGMLLICYDIDNGIGAEMEIRGGNFTYGSKESEGKTISYLMEVGSSDYGFYYKSDDEKLKIFESIPNSTLKIYGGTFSTDPSNIIPDYSAWDTNKTINYVADGYEAVENENGTWTVQKRGEN